MWRHTTELQLFMRIDSNTFKYIGWSLQPGFPVNLSQPSSANSKADCPRALPQRKLESTGELNVRSGAVPNVYAGGFRRSDNLPSVPHNHILRQAAHCRSYAECQIEEDRIVVCQCRNDTPAFSPALTTAAAAGVTSPCRAGTAGPNMIPASPWGPRLPPPLDS